ncbi:MAG: hypothetical protein ACJATT_006042, partial [Myxococcota bacterium]
SRRRDGKAAKPKGLPFILRGEQHRHRGCIGAEKERLF